MLYKFAHILRDKLSWLWNIIEWMNGVVFSMRYGKRLKRFAFSTVPDGYEIVPIKDVPIEKLVDFFGEDTRRIWQDKIEGEGFPYFELDRSVSKSNVNMPASWKKIIFKEDGAPKKVIIYVTGISKLMQQQKKMIDKMRSVFETFKENKDEIALIWRPDPLVDATIPTVNPLLCQEYKKLKEEYKKAGWGIYDDSGDTERVLSLADAYYGDPDKIIQRCRLMKMPVMIQNADVI